MALLVDRGHVVEESVALVLAVDDPVVQIIPVHDEREVQGQRDERQGDDQAGVRVPDSGRTHGSERWAAARRG